MNNEYLPRDILKILRERSESPAVRTKAGVILGNKKKYINNLKPGDLGDK